MDHLVYCVELPKRKQAKCMDVDNINSKHQMDDISPQNHRRTLRSKQPKSQILQQMKKTNQCPKTNHHSTRLRKSPKNWGLWRKIKRKPNQKEKGEECNRCEGFSLPMWQWGIRIPVWQWGVYLSFGSK